jgi:aconitate decarboxylase
MQGLTEGIAQFAAHPEALRIEDAVRNTVRNGFTDTVGVMLASRDAPVTNVVRRFVSERRSTRADARLLFDVERASSRDAALVNATAGHAIDYDDVGLQGHPSVVLVPALLAEGERLRAPGEALLRAYVVGYETWAELLLRDEDLLHLKGWHPTSVFGVVAVAAAIAALRGLDVTSTRHAIALAASMAGGLVANFGSMAKPFHAGRAAAQGIDAADLASAGMTAARDTLEHPAGLLAALSPRGKVDRGPASAELGRTLRMASLGLTIKKYPMCFATHRVIDATLDLALAHGLNAGDVRSIDATVGTAQASMLRNHRPTDALEARFSLEFAVAGSLVAGRLGLSELTDEFVRRDDVQELFGRLHVTTTDTVCPYEQSLAASDRVVIHTTGGGSFDSGEISGTRGDAATALASHELEAKFMDCTTGMAYLDRGGLYRSLQMLDRCEDVSLLG